MAAGDTRAMVGSSVTVVEDLSGGVRPALLGVARRGYVRECCAKLPNLIAAFVDDRVDRGWDVLARYPVKGPFETTVETWAVQIKLYGHDRRVGVTQLNQLLGILAGPAADKCLLVTSGQLTSVARSFVANANREGRQRMRLMDGTELTARLLEHPEIVRQFFGTVA